MEKRRDMKSYICAKPRRIAEIEIFNGCNAKCVVCPRGLGLMSNPCTTMDFELYKKIVDKCADLKVEGVSLFSWGDPLLNKDLPKYCEYAHNKMEVYLSSNLNMNADFEKFLPHINSMSISVSGFKQETYEINHRGLNIEKVKKNLRIIESVLAKMEKADRPYIELKWFDYDYNKGELDMWREFLNLDLINIYIIKGNYNPIKNRKKIAKGHTFTNDDEFMGRVWMSGYRDMDKIDLRYCNYIHKFAIDVQGRLLLCCEPMYDERMVIGDFLKDDIYEMQLKKLHHKQCLCCEVWNEQVNLLRKHEIEAIKNKTFL